MATQPDFQIKEQNFSGVHNCYRTPPHRTYVVDVHISTDVRGDILQEAVNDVIERAPYFADALVERDGDFFYAKNPLPMEVAEGGLRAVGGPETNWHNLDVTYEGNVMSFSMFHALCDGLGLNLFIESVLNRYFCRMVRAFESDVYVGAFAEQLEKRGINFVQGKEISYITPENGLIEGLGLRQ